MNRTRLKICGITREEDVDAVVASGADAIGFVFYPKSPRYVSPERAAELIARLPPFVTPVGLFVNTPVDEIAATTATSGIALLQFHGDETPAQCDAARAATGRPYLRAARVAPTTRPADLIDFTNDFSHAQAILLDTHVEGFGGGGKVFDWSQVPRNVTRPLVLSGGLNPANVRAGIAALKPFAVDVSSGVESAKGIKSATLIAQFVAAVRQADAAHLIASNASNASVE